MTGPLEGEGTPELAWQSCTRLPLLRPVSAATMVPAGSRAVIIAPHPDDEILMCGGLLQQLNQLGRPCVIVAVTDGEASHPHSTLWPADRLRSVRRLESQAALTRLVIGAPICLPLEFPDADLGRHHAPLLARLRRIIKADDVVFTTWANDGHPDHEACGILAAQAAVAVGATLIEVPVWTWHWATPGDHRIPWQRACSLALSHIEVQRKQQAMAAFHSQLHPDTSTGRTAVLPASTLGRLLRPHEIYFL